MRKRIFLPSALVLTALLAVSVHAEPGIERPEKNAFHKSTNKTIVFDGSRLSVPEYISSADEELSTGDNLYYYAEDGEATAFFETMYSDLNEALTAAEFRDQMDTYDQSLISPLGSPEILSSLDATVAGFPGRILHVSCKVQGKKLEAYFTYFFKDEEDRVIVLSLCQTDNTQYDYFSDYYKIIATAVKDEDAAGTESGGSSLSDKTGPGVIPSTGTVGQQNALTSALEALEQYAFSYAGLISSLQSAGYSAEEAAFAADNCGADWKEQAVRAAQENLALSPYTREALIGQLQSEGFTYEEAEYGAAQNEALLQVPGTDASIQGEAPTQEEYYEDYYEETSPEEYYTEEYVEDYPSEGY